MNNKNVTNFSYGESKRKQILLGFGITGEFQKSITSNDMLEKGGKHGMIGEIRNGYKKIAEGKWKKVSEHGFTKEEHEEKSKLDKWSKRYTGKTKEEHDSEASKLDDKDYDDAHVMGIENKEGDTLEKGGVGSGKYDRKQSQQLHKRLKDDYHHKVGVLDRHKEAKDSSYNGKVGLKDADNNVSDARRKLREHTENHAQKHKELLDTGDHTMNQKMKDKYSNIQKSFTNGFDDYLEKGLNTSHLTLKQVTDINGKQTKRWVNPDGTEHAEHGSHADFEHGGEKKSGKVGRVSSSGKYVIHGDDGTIYKKHHHEITPRVNGKQVNGQPTAKVKQDGKKLNTPHHKLARTKSSDVLKRYISGKDTTHEYHTSAEDVLKERGELPADHKSTFKGKIPDASKADKNIQNKLNADNSKPIDSDPQETDAEIVQQVVERFEDFADAVGGVVDGMKKSAIMYGSGGVGKTFTTKKELERKFGKGRMFDPVHHTPGSDEYDYVFIDGGKVTSTSFYQLMWEHNDKVMCFDDCDSALEDPDIKGYLKGALGSQQSQVSNMSQREVKSSDGSKIPKQFNFGGKMIFITNIPKETITKSKDMQPIMSRSFAQDMTMDRRTTMAYIKHIAKDKKGQLTNMTFDGIKNYSHDEMDHVIKMLDKHSEKAFDLNARSVETLLGFSKMAQARVDRADLDQQADGGMPLTDKEKEKIFDENFQRKSINYLYQHKTVNGKLDKDHIAKGFVEMFGCSVDEMCAYIKLGLN